jgi:hypothetical protein
MLFLRPDRQQPPPSLLVIRFIWAALIGGPLIFLAVLIFVLLPRRVGVANPQPLLPWINLAMLLTAIPVVFVVRTVIFRLSKKRTGRITLQAYSVGNLFFWAGCESVAFAGMMFALINGSLWPTIVFSGIALAMQAITFPRKLD